MRRTTKPTILEVSLIGSYTPGTNTMSLFVDPKTVKYVIGERCTPATHRLAHSVGSILLSARS